jgi:hypothetical protein
MMFDLLSVLGSTEFYPHAICLDWDPLMLWTYSMVDMTIWASYMAIGTALVSFRGRGVPMDRLSLDFLSAFITLCGFTHLTDVVILFVGLYRLDLIVRIATALVSSAAAFHMARQVAAGGRQTSPP